MNRRFNISSISNRFTREEMGAIAPAIFATAPANHVSPKYQFVNTGNVLELLNSKGWEAFEVCQQKSRIPGLEDATKHSISLVHKDANTQNRDLGSLIPTLTLVNSHNWASRFEIVFGMFRVVCGNGLTVMAGEFAGLSARHDHIMEDILSIIERMESYSSMMMTKFQNWNTRMLSEDETLHFGMEASRIRFGEADSSELAIARAESLLTTRRAQDAENSLWNVYNRVQENSLQGGVKRDAMTRMPRAITNIGKRLELNAQLFGLAENFYRNN